MAPSRLRRHIRRPRRRRLEVDHVTVVEKQPMKKAIAGALVGNAME
ncbi:hypothetical protein [Luteococcus sp.]